MANESTYALISDLLPLIWEGALNYAQHSFVMPRLVTSFTDRTGFVDRKVSEYVETGVTDNVAETDDLTPTAYDRNLKSTLTVKEVGKQYLLTDRRVESDTEGVMVDAARDLGYAIGKKVEQDLLGDFASFTGGIFGGEGVAFSMNHIFAARARLEAAAIPGPYLTVIHPAQYFDIYQSFTSLSNPAPLSIRDLVQNNYYVTRVADVDIVVSTLVPKTAVQNEIQSVAITGTPTGGTFTLKLGDQETAAIAYNASAAAVLTAIEALPNVGAGNTDTSGGALPGTAVAVTFNAALAGEDIPTMTLGVNALTGGTNPTVTVTVTQEGKNYARGAVFTRDALALDVRRGFRIEPERDASHRWWELNATMAYAHGLWRGERGVILKSDATIPLS